MKKNFAILGILVAFTASAATSHADVTAPSKTAKCHGQCQAKKVAVSGSRRNQEVFYITNHTVTGSNIPVVVTRYQGHNIASSPLVAYDQSDISATGALNVAGALTTRDPAITMGRGR